MATTRRRLRLLDRSQRLALFAVALGGTIALSSAAIPGLGNVGSGYFLRLGILLAGLGLARLLRP